VGSSANSERWHVFANPAAGRATLLRHEVWLRDTLAEHGYRLHWLEARMGLAGSQQVAEAIEAGARRLLVIGGDGTHHYAINGLMQQQACAPEEVAYALLPSGTGNDWAREHRIPHRRTDWLRMFQAQRYARQDLALIEARDLTGAPLRRYSANVVGLGYDAVVVQRLAQRQITHLGSTSYFSAIYQCLRTYRPVPLRVSTDDGSWEAAFYTLNAGICRYSGGGMRFVPQARPDDGLLAYTLVDELPGWRVAINTPWLYTPFFDRHPLTRSGRSRRFEAHHLQAPTLVEADGELIGQSPVRIEVQPLALRFLCP
jgi:diacylglycerol kinase (ATP)